MLRDIQAGDFLLRRGTQSEDRPDDGERDRDGNRGESCRAEHADQLDPEQFEPTAVEQAGQLIARGIREAVIRNGVRGEQADCNGTPDAVQAVDRNRSDRIVHTQDVVQEPDTEYHQKARDRTDHDRPETVDRITGRCDCHQSGERSVQAHGHVRLAVAHPGKDHAYDRSDRRGDRSRQEDRSQLGYADRRGSVEPVPAKPQDKHTQRSDRNVVAGKSVDPRDLSFLVLSELADPRPQHGSPDQCADAADHVDAVGSCEIMEADPCQPAPAPGPVRLDRVNDRGDHRGIDTVGDEPGAFCHCAGYDGCRRRAEHQVKDERRPVKAGIVGKDLQPLH